jgi:hypothetical protein
MCFEQRSNDQDHSRSILSVKNWPQDMMVFILHLRLYSSAFMYLTFPSVSFQNLIGILRDSLCARGSTRCKPFLITWQYTKTQKKGRNTN